MGELQLSYGIGSGESRQRRILQVLFLLIVAATVFFVGIGNLPLTDPDEGRYALIGRNMVERNNYLEPWLGNDYYAKKPVLYFWMTAASFRAFGPDNPQFAARIVPVIGATLAVLATYLVAAALFNHTLGLLSAGCVLCTVTMVGLGKFVRMDVYLVAFLTLAFWAFLKGYRTQGPSRWYLLMYPFLALVALVKSPMILIIPFGIILTFVLWQRLAGQSEWKVLGDMRPMLGLGIIIALAGPWFMYMVMQHKDYVHRFFGVENLSGRMLGVARDTGHHNSPLLYVGTLVVGLLPWTPLAVLGLLRYGRSALTRGGTDWESRFLFLWFMFVMVVFSIPQTRLFHYVFPAVIPAAIFLARFLYDYWQSDFPRRRRQLTFTWAYPMGLMVALLVVGMYLVAAFGSGWIQLHGRWEGLKDLHEPSWWVRWGWLVVLVYRVILAGALAKVLWYLWRNWLLPQFVVTIGVAFLLLIVDVSYTDLPRLADLGSCRRLVPLIRNHADPSTVVLEGPVTENQRWSLPFYAGTGLPIRYIQCLADLSEYYKSPQKMIFLSRDDDAYVQMSLHMGKRAEILAEFGRTKLILIREKESPLSTGEEASAAP